MQTHGEVLRILTGDSSLVTALRTDYRTASLTKRHRLMLDYVAKLTETPSSMQKTDIDLLLGAGFDEASISDICWITGYFAMLNRIADGLGLEAQQGEHPPVDLPPEAP